MNASVTDPLHPSIVYYDSDYPSKEFPVHPENFDAVVWHQGIADDVDYYKQLPDLRSKKILELCCGTGRVAIPLAMMGCSITAVDISAGLLQRFKKKIKIIADFPRENLTIIKQDVTKLSLPETNYYNVVICAFNSLLCIADFYLQQQTLLCAAKYLAPGGILLLDIWNPLIVNVKGHEPEYFFSRKRVDNGNRYVRYAATGPLKENQVQDVYGWYDETLGNGNVIQTPYSLEWRIIFRYELELMLEKAGFRIENLFGGNRKEPFHSHSLKMFVEAVKL